MKTVAIILLLMLPLGCLAQGNEDLQKFENLFGNKTPVHKWGGELKNNKNEITFIFSAAFVIYKTVLSSQDIDACVFTPSCSVYTIESIKKDGIIKGFFSGVDRLTRCNPGRNKHLSINPKTGKYDDPVE